MKIPENIMLVRKNPHLLLRHSFPQVPCPWVCLTADIGFLPVGLKKCKGTDTLAHILTSDAAGINFLNYETTDFDAGTFVSRVHRVSPE